MECGEFDMESWQIQCSVMTLFDWQQSLWSVKLWLRTVQESQTARIRNNPKLHLGRKGIVWQYQWKSTHYTQLCFFHFLQFKRVKTKLCMKDRDCAFEDKLPHVFGVVCWQTNIYQMCFFVLILSGFCSGSLSLSEWSASVHDTTCFLGVF